MYKEREGGKGPKPRRQSGGSCCSWHTRLSWQGMSTGSQGCYGNIWESTHTHTALSPCTCVLCVRFGSAYTCSLLIRHVVRTQKPRPDTSVRPPIKAVAMHSSPHSCQDARWHQPSWQPQGQRSSSSSSAGRARSLPVGEAQRVVSSGCRMDLVCHVCVASPACTACLMSTKGQHGGTTRM